MRSAKTTGFPSQTCRSDRPWEPAPISQAQKESGRPRDGSPHMRTTNSPRQPQTAPHWSASSTRSHRGPDVADCRCGWPHLSSILRSLPTHETTQHGRMSARARIVPSADFRFGSLRSASRCGCRVGTSVASLGGPSCPPLVTGTRLALPIDDHLPDACAALADAGGLVLCAPPGAGKTTRVPPALLDAGLAGTRKILVLQPRRVAAKATAARMAQERACPLGQQIGYQVRFESRCSSATRIAVVTEGILLRRLLDDPFLEDVGLIVFDEFHERSLASDLALAMIRQVQESVRPDLKIVVMSATLAPQAVAEYLGGVPVLHCPGRTFPVTIRYLCDWSRRPLVDEVVAAVPELFEETEGDLLVFLPGVHEIRQCRRRLADWADSRGIELALLYGDLPLSEQTAVLARASRRRVILQGDIPSPANPPVGCNFNTRCPIAQEICFRDDPEYREIKPRHWVACHFAEQFLPSAS